MNKYTIEKTVSYGGRFKTRLHIKAFKTSQAMHEFLNKQTNNNWKVSQHDFKSGVYACIGRRYINMKSLDGGVLAHI